MMIIAILRNKLSFHARRLAIRAGVLRLYSEIQVGGVKLSRYNMLVNVLDGIRKEAKLFGKYSKLYGNSGDDPDSIWQARTRAYVHLYLKVMFGLNNFVERESYVTDGSYDGGIDGYFIDTNKKIVYLIQSKFRTTEDNFENKPIEIQEILSMQIKRVLGGNELDEDGHEYNGKILGLQRRVSEIGDLGRYKYKVVILANMRGVSDFELRKLSDGFEVEIVNYEESYRLLLFPVLSGTLFKATDLTISIDISNKSSGSKISYRVSARDFECDISVVFVPTIEIARIMSSYKNSILKYNPRSYLDFIGERVNDSIKKTIVDSETNEFALMNNGITVVCDESGINEQSGRKNRAQLFLLNPQIINGGQTAYTLSRLYEETADENRERLFSGKEVLVKAIALAGESDKNNIFDKQIELIEKISAATNSQTAVTQADRASNNDENIIIQKILYDKHGLLYERKRGEFSEGLREEYIDKKLIVDRSLFLRIFLASNGSVSLSSRRKVKFENIKFDKETIESRLEKFVIGYYAFKYFTKDRSSPQLRFSTTAPMIFAACIVAEKLDGTSEMIGVQAAQIAQERWPDYLAHLSKRGIQIQRYKKNKSEMSLEERATRHKELKQESIDYTRSFFLS